MGARAKSGEPRYVFGLSASPKAPELLGFVASEGADGEFVEGVPTLASVGSAGQVKLNALDAPKGPDDFSIPVWSSDSSIAYLLLDSGIFQFDLPSHKSTRLLSGNMTGLALSRSGNELAFWLSEKGSETLVLFDLRKMKERWRSKISNQYEGDEYGHELAFSPDDELLYARCYDETNRTPLRMYDIKTGANRVFTANVTSVASYERGIIFIEVRGRVKKLVIVTSARKHVFWKSETSFTKLNSSGSHRWVVLQNLATKEVGLVDSQSLLTNKLGFACDAATVLSDGTIVCSLNGKVTVKTHATSKSLPGNLLPGSVLNQFNVYENQEAKSACRLEGWREKGVCYSKMAPGEAKAIIPVIENRVSSGDEQCWIKGKT